MHDGGWNFLRKNLIGKRVLDVVRYFTYGFVSLINMVSFAAGGLSADIREAAFGVAGHPRLFMSPAQAADLQATVAADGLNTRIAELVIAGAEEAMNQPPVIRELQGRRMLHVSRRALDRIGKLAMAWHLQGDRKYVDRAIAELRAISAFEDWNPSHFLDTAEMTMAAAIGYDWLYDELDAATRAMVREAIFEKALTPALASDDHWWIQTTNNWNQVCHGGLLAGALVLLEHHPEEALRKIERAVRHIPHAMGTYAPSGAYPEGPSYWAYGTNYNVMFLAMLESALGTTFGLDRIEGFEETGAFPQLMTGPSGLLFNFSDGRPNRHPLAAVYWLARHFDRPAWAAAEDPLFAKSTRSSWLSCLTLLWRDPAAPPPENQLPLHWTSRNSVPVSVHRESWEKPESVFIGVKAGPPAASHGQMDAGSFVLDANGVRWAHDLGMEKYHQVESQGIALWHTHQNAGRWRVFRNNNLSHNTLVIDGQLQHAGGDALMVRFSDDPAFPHSVVDMSTAYHAQVEQAQRGIALLPGGVVLVRDHLTGLRPGAEVRWGMVTRAEALQNENGLMGLREAGEEMEITIHSENATAWKIIDLAEPVQSWDSPNPGFRMIAFTAMAPASGVLDLTVTLRPGGRPVSELTATQLGPPLEWSASRP